VAKKKTLDIFNYDFDFQQSSQKKGKKTPKEECCEKYKKKGEKKCKSCPKRIVNS
jgi:hypothetical protein